MAVDTRHLSLFPPQIPTNREMGNFIEANGNLYSAQIGGYGVVPGPPSGTTTATDAPPLIPMYGSVPAKTSMKSDSSLTYAIPASRKRSRETPIPANLQNNHNHYHLPLLSSFPANVQNNHQTINNNAGRCGSFTSLGEDISYQIQRQQLEIDRFIAEHTEKVRMEIEERKKRYCRRVMAAVEESIMHKLRAKEEEIEKIGKLNWALEERVNSLCVENQIWRELAQTNEATANALRTNLEVVLAQVEGDQDHQRGGDTAALMDDAESCCGDNYDVVEEENSRNNSHDDGGGINRLCRKCGKDEPSVLFLPCRHLCLCSVCGPSLHTCPLCKCTKNASLHLNLSSSP